MLSLTRNSLHQHSYVMNTAFSGLNKAKINPWCGSKKTAGNSYYGLAIGFTLLTAAYSIGGISGCAINPAVAVGLTAMGLSKLANLWIFLVANFAGGALAAGLFKLVNSEE